MNFKSHNNTDESNNTETRHIPDQILLEPYHYLQSNPGKDIRGKLIDCFQLWLQLPDPMILKAIKQIIADLHTASLLIDDIEDNSKMRRGNPVAHSIFGIPSVLNCGNYVYFLALQRCHELQNQKAMQIFVTEMINLHRGQGCDITWRDNLKCPSEEQYCSMVQDKTGGLFRLAVGLMQAFSTQTTDFTPLVNKLALYFQIRDDLINLSDSEYMKQKSFCEDLTEGKFSFPIIHAIKKTPESSKLLAILKQRTQDDLLKKYAQQLMYKEGSLEYTKQKCILLKQEITELVEELGGNPLLENIMQYLHTQVDSLDTSVVPNQND